MESLHEEAVFPRSVIVGLYEVIEIVVSTDLRIGGAMPNRRLHLNWRLRLNGRLRLGWQKTGCSNQENKSRQIPQSAKISNERLCRLFHKSSGWQQKSDGPLFLLLKDEG